MQYVYKMKVVINYTYIEISCSAIKYRILNAQQVLLNFQYIICFLLYPN